MTQTESLLQKAENALERRDLAALLPYAEALQPLVTSGGRAVYDFFSRLTREVICCPEPHIRLFAHCLDAVCAYDPVEGLAFLESMLAFTYSVENASVSPQGILH
ncbi:MAG: hypothetical protein LBR76_06810 [Oscillospiraceae bacterium]|nr:hypothetical protein [Oscillospiraceae bacterium]